MSMKKRTYSYPDPPFSYWLGVEGLDMSDLMLGTPLLYHWDQREASGGTDVRGFPIAVV